MSPGNCKGCVAGDATAPEPISGNGTEENCMGTKNYLVISDIHANAEALCAVFARLDTFRPDVFVVAGDIVGYGADPRLVIDHLRRLGDALVAVDGNHDRAARDKEGPVRMNSEAATALRRTRDTIGSAEAAFLLGLPGMAVTGPFTVVHDPAVGSERHAYVRSPRQAQAVLAGVHTPHVIVGHTHLPGFFEATLAGDGTTVARVADFVPFTGDEVLRLKAEARYVLNPGSVGQPRDGDPRASYLEITEGEDGSISVRACRVGYDVATAQAKMRSRGFPEFGAERLAFGR
jgi:predicted phosphodiesterase